MKIWEIDEALEALVDEETGELLDFEAFEQLQMERDRKIEGMGCWLLDMTADVKKIKEQEAVLEERRKKVERNRDRLKAYLDTILGGDGFKTARVVMSYRKSPAHVEFDSAFMDWAKNNRDDLLRYKEPEVNKKAVADALKAGEDVPHAWMADGGMSLTIK